MKSNLDINTFLFTLVTASVGTTLTGGVYKMERPKPGKEDIVVSTLPLDEDDSPQLATCNVNIHVPNKHISIDGFPHAVADTVRMQELTNVLLTALDENVNTTNNYHHRVTKQSIFEEPAADEHIVNLRLELRIF